MAFLLQDKDGNWHFKRRRYSSKNYDPIYIQSNILRSKRKKKRKKIRAAIRVRFKRAGNCRIIYFPLFKITRHASFKLGNNVGVRREAARRHVQLKCQLKVSNYRTMCRILNIFGSSCELRSFYSRRLLRSL